MTDTSISSRLKEERKRLGLTQQGAASAVGVERETWSRYESEAIKPSAEVVAAFSEVGADVQYILTGHRGALALTVEQECAGYVVEVLSPAEEVALRTLRSSGLLAYTATPIKGSVSAGRISVKGESNQVVGTLVGGNTGEISNGKKAAKSGGKRKS